MTTSLTSHTDKRDIALQYLGISARKLKEARGYDQAIAAVKTLHIYIKLAQENHCTDTEMMFALGYGPERFNTVLKQVQ